TAYSRAGAGSPGAARLLGVVSGGRIWREMMSPCVRALAFSRRAATAGTSRASAAARIRRRLAPHENGRAKATIIAYWARMPWAWSSIWPHSATAPATRSAVIADAPRGGDEYQA